MARLLKWTRSGGYAKRPGQSPRQIGPGTVTPPTGPDRPAAANILRYEDLTGANLSATVESAGTTKEVSFGTGTFEFADFAQGGNVYGAMILNAAGLRGSGIGYTTLRMTPNSSTQAGKVPASNPPASNGQTNPLRLLRVGWEQQMTPRHVSGFTLEATPQGHLHHGAIAFYNAPGSVWEDIKIKGVPGNLSREPGETFSMECFRCSGVSGNPITLRRIEVDGINTAGATVAASGFGVNFGEYITFEDTYAHDVAQAHGYALYETGNLTFTRAKAARCALNGFNFENVSGTVALNQCEISAAGSGQHIWIATNKGNAVYTITDPVYDGPKLKVRVSGYSGSGRTQNPADIHMYVNGVERPDLMTVTVTN